MRTKSLLLGIVASLVLSFASVAAELGTTDVHSEAMNKDRGGSLKGAEYESGENGDKTRMTCSVPYGCDNAAFSPNEKCNVVRKTGNIDAPIPAKTLKPKKCRIRIRKSLSLGIRSKK